MWERQLSRSWRFRSSHNGGLWLGCQSGGLPTFILNGKVLNAAFWRCPKVLYMFPLETTFAVWIHSGQYHKIVEKEGLMSLRKLYFGTVICRPFPERFPLRGHIVYSLRRRGKPGITHWVFVKDIVCWLMFSSWGCDVDQREVENLKNRSPSDVDYEYTSSNKLEEECDLAGLRISYFQ